MVASTDPPIISAMKNKKVKPDAVDADEEKLAAKEMTPPTTPPRLNTIQNTAK